MAFVFEGEEGWIFVTRSGSVTSSDPVSSQRLPPLMASDPAILDSQIGPNEIHLYESTEQHTNWVQCIKSRETTVAPVDVAHRSTSACLIAPHRDETSPDPLLGSGKRTL